MIHISYLNLNTILVFFLSFLAGSCAGNYEQEAPDGMVYFEGGEITIGSKEGEPNEAPEFDTTVEPFYLDKHPVTVKQFREFVEDTGYETEAEQFGNSGVFDFDTGQWQLAEGASWEYPQGKAAGKAKDDHPVTQVSWNDAKAYSDWAGRRLPSEVEWEYAAKSGENTDEQYSWGDELVQDGQYQANVWQGSFPRFFENEDGYRYTSPVGEFGETPAGLTDMGGNVWEWTGTVYQLYEGNPGNMRVDSTQKVIRGGSFLCDKDVCHSYRVTARQFNSRESATSHMGFRTAKDL